MSSVPQQYLALVDDAAVFPPGNAPLADAVAAHLARRAKPWADLVGPFVVKDVTLPDLLATLRESAPSAPLRVAVVVTGGAGALEPAARWASRAEELELASVEIALRDEEDLARNAQRVTTMVDQLRAAGDLDEDVAVHVEPPRPLGPAPEPSWLAALDEVATADLRLKLRTGGLEADAFPPARTLAACIEAALDRELAFKCTAGMHNAVRHRDPATGFEHHGFLNVLLATRASLDGAATDDVVAVLEDADPRSVRSRALEVGEDALARTRRWFTSVGSCSVHEAHDDLVALGLFGTASTGS